MKIPVKIPVKMGTRTPYRRARALLSACVLAVLQRSSSSALEIERPARDLTVDCEAAGSGAELDAWLADHGGASTRDACAGDCSRLTVSGFRIQGLRVNGFYEQRPGEAVWESATHTIAFSADEGAWEVRKKPEAEGASRPAHCDSALPGDGPFDCKDWREWGGSDAGHIPVDATFACGGVIVCRELVVSGFVEQGDRVNGVYSRRSVEAVWESATHRIEWDEFEELWEILEKDDAATRAAFCDPPSGEPGEGPHECEGWREWRGNDLGYVPVDTSFGCSPSEIRWDDDFSGLPAGCVSISVTFTATDPCGASVSTTATFTLAPGGARPLRRGDCNDDGGVDISDAIATLAALFLGQGEIHCQDACDANDDGLVDTSDPIRTLGLLFLGLGSLPQPGDFACGVDPTADGMGCAEFRSCD